MPIDPRSYPDRLIRGLDDPDGAVAVRAAEALARRCDAEDAIPVLIDALRRRWREAEVAAGIVRALGHFAPAETTAVRIEAMAHDSRTVRRAAARGLRTGARPSMAC